MSVLPSDASILHRFLGSVINRNELSLGGAMLFWTVFGVVWCRSHCDFWNWLLYLVCDY